MQTCIQACITPRLHLLWRISENGLQLSRHCGRQRIESIATYRNVNICSFFCRLYPLVFTAAWPPVAYHSAFVAYPQAHSILRLTKPTIALICPHAIAAATNLGSSLPSSCASASSCSREFAITPTTILLFYALVPTVPSNDFQLLLVCMCVCGRLDLPVVQLLLLWQKTVTFVHSQHFIATSMFVQMPDPMNTDAFCKYVCVASATSLRN